MSHTGYASLINTIIIKIILHTYLLIKIIYPLYPCHPWKNIGFSVDFFLNIIGTYSELNLFQLNPIIFGEHELNELNE